MNKTERGLYIVKTLNKLYPNPQIPLKHKSVFTLLVAVVLSAQCTDKKVNEVTKILFSEAKNPQEMEKLGVEKIKKIIRPCGLSPRKSKSIHKLSSILIKDFLGKVPKSFEELESLPGVGHKTASVIMSQGFNYPAFPVDTHIHRLSQRWRLTSGKNVKTTEQDLKKIFPENLRNILHIQIILYGREFCQARSCFGIMCKICKACNPKRIKPIQTLKA